MRPRLPTPSSLRCLRSAGLVAILLALSCLNPQPDDFPQSAPSAAESAPVQGPADVRPADNAGQPPSPQTPTNSAAPAAPTETPAITSPGLDLAADAGTPLPDAGPADAGPAVAQ